MVIVSLFTFITFFLICFNCFKYQHVIIISINLSRNELNDIAL